MQIERHIIRANRIWEILKVACLISVILSIFIKYRIHIKTVAENTVVTKRIFIHLKFPDRKISEVEKIIGYNNKGTFTLRSFNPYSRSDVYNIEVI